MSVHEKMTAIADAIRAKTGREEKLSLDEMAVGVGEVYEAGKQAEYDAFWDAYLNPTGFSNWACRFAGYGWNSNTFHPPCDIVPTTGCTQMFCQCGIKDLKGLCEELGIAIDFSKATGFSQTFSDSQITTVGEINTTSAANINYLLYNATSMVSIDKVVLKNDGSQTANLAFQNARKLENITFEGVFGSSVNFQWSPLSKASIESIINCLSTATNGLSVTLSKTAVESAFGSTTADEWTALIATRSNWTISLV